MNAPAPKIVGVAVIAQAWLDAKQERDEAAQRMSALAAELVKALPGEAEEGTTKAEFAGGLKVTVTRKLNRAVDTAALSSAWESAPAIVQSAFRWKAECDLKALRAIQFANPDAYAIAAKYITTKPAAASVDVEIKE